MAKKKESFESALKRLEEVVDAMERGDLPLEKLLENYQEGVSLLAYCRDQLDTARAQMDEQLKSDEGK